MCKLLYNSVSLGTVGHGHCLQKFVWVDGGDANAIGLYTLSREDRKYSIIRVSRMPTDANTRKVVCICVRSTRLE